MLYVVSRCCYGLCSCVFFKHKTAYKKRISEWSSDVCSADLRLVPRGARKVADEPAAARAAALSQAAAGQGARPRARADRTCVVQVKCVSVRVDLGRRRLINISHNYLNTNRPLSHHKSPYQNITIYYLNHNQHTLTHNK